MLEKIVLYLMEQHRGKTIGILLGLVASIFFIAYGFWRTLFVILCIMLGYFIGKEIDQNQGWDQWVQKFIRKRD
ncbi:MAG: DUF2273 domain-containing protein [Syntrophomonadaceae bacterium]|nr:DUF2273 domain-containing protein [Syntrophomonadaceae bacterium]